MQHGVSGEELSAEESDSPQSDKCVMATAAIWKLLVRDAPQFSLLHVEMDQCTIFSAKCLQELEFWKVEAYLECVC